MTPASNVTNSSGKRLITDKIADSLSRFRELDTRLETPVERLQGQIDQDGLNGILSDDEVTDEDYDDNEESEEQYTMLSKIINNDGLLKTKNIKSKNISNDVSDSGDGTNNHHLNNKEIWLEYGCI